MPKSSKDIGGQVPRVFRSEEFKLTTVYLAQF